eukprot:3501526-Prymnesium_polylepis.3
MDVIVSVLTIIPMVLTVYLGSPLHECIRETWKRTCFRNILRGAHTVNVADPAGKGESSTLAVRKKSSVVSVPQISAAMVATTFRADAEAEQRAKLVRHAQTLLSKSTVSLLRTRLGAAHFSASCSHLPTCLFVAAYSSVGAGRNNLPQVG